MIRRLLVLALLLPTLAWASYDSVITADSPWNWWRYDESSGTTATDQCTSGLNPCHNGTYTGGFTLGTTGISGNPGHTAVTLNGSTGYVSAPSSASLTTDYNLPIANNDGATWEGWFKPASVKNQYLIAFQKYVNPFGYDDYAVYAASDGSITTYVYTDASSCGAAGTYGTAATATSAYTSGNWYYVVFTSVGNAGNNGLSSLKIYLNASLKQTTTSFSGTIGRCSMGLFMGVGNDAPAGNYFDGVMDEIAFYSTNVSHVGTGALSQSQITTHYNSGVLSPPTDWPYTVKRPILPRFMDDGYFARAASWGYNTGLWSEKILQPRFLTVGYLPFEVLPNGNAH